VKAPTVGIHMLADYFVWLKDRQQSDLMSDAELLGGSPKNYRALDLTELELRKLRWTQTDFGRTSTLELLRGLSTSRKVLQPSEPHLSLPLLYIE
jgi:hypothetical protein